MRDPKPYAECNPADTHAFSNSDSDTNGHSHTDVDSDGYRNCRSDAAASSNSAVAPDSAVINAGLVSYFGLVTPLLNVLASTLNQHQDAKC